MGSLPELGEVHLLWDVVDDLIASLAGPERVADLTSARDEYDERRGRVFQDEELWESWTQSFLEWYVVERVPPDAEVPPLLTAMRCEGDPERREAMAAWLTSHRSLFEVIALPDSRVELRDVIGKAAFSVLERRGMKGVSIGDVAEMRLLGYRGEVVFARTFCFHPTGTREAICRHVTRILEQGGDRRDAIDHVASLRIRSERYRHVSAVKVYDAPDGLLRSPTARSEGS